MRMALYNWTGYGTKDKDSSLPIKKFMSGGMELTERNPVESGESVYYYDTPDFDLAKHGGFCRIIQRPECPNVCFIDYAKHRKGRVFHYRTQNAEPSASIFDKILNRQDMQEVIRYTSSKRIYTAKYNDYKMKIDGRGAYVEVGGEKCKIDRVLGKPSQKIMRMLSIKDVTRKYNKWKHSDKTFVYSVNETFEKFDNIMQQDITSEKLEYTRYDYMLGLLGLKNKKTKEINNDKQI